MQIRTCHVKSYVVALRHLSGNAWEKSHELQEREEFSAGQAVTARCCSHQMAFLLFPWSCWARDTFAPKYHHFVAPLLHSLKHFTTQPDASELPVSAAAPSAVRMYPAAKQFCEDQPRNLEWSWQLNIPLGFKVMLLQWNTGLLIFFLLLRAVLVSMVVLPGL